MVGSAFPTLDAGGRLAWVETLAPDEIEDVKVMLDRLGISHGPHRYREH